MQDFDSAFGRGGLNDQVSVDALMDECGLDEDEIAWRKEFVGFDDADARRLANLQDLFAEQADRIADDFYENLTRHDQTEQVIGRSEKGSSS
ncbi:protoglobin domain-containing protein [Haloplanus litoreus]|uniref:protoglobin domain-containing protein n=1 Tax=Haloplanus litoreus TaxID=767515 RepID=UPI00360878E8